MKKNYCIDDYVGMPLKGHEDQHKYLDFNDKECLEMFLYHFETLASSLEDFTFAFRPEKPVHIGEVLCRNMMAIISFQCHQVRILLNNCIGNVPESNQNSEASPAE